MHLKTCVRHSYSNDKIGRGGTERAAEAINCIRKGGKFSLRTT